MVGRGGVVLVSGQAANLSDMPTVEIGVHSPS